MGLSPAVFLDGLSPPSSLTPSVRTRRLVTSRRYANCTAGCSKNQYLTVTCLAITLMFRVAWKMLTGDSGKFLGLVLGVAFASFLMAQQVSVFMGILKRTASQVVDVSDANIWVMDPNVRFVDEINALPDTDLYRVRGVKGVDWAVPFFKGQGRVRLDDGRFRNVMLLGLDDNGYVGAPQQMVLGSVADLDRSDAIIVDTEGWKLIWPHETYQLNREVQLNDRRGVIVGVCKASIPFTTMPVFYTRYSQATGYIPQERDRMSYVLAMQTRFRPRRGLP